MKIKLVALTAILVILVAAGIQSNSYYTRRDCRVMWNRNGIVCVQDIFGNLWEFEGTGFKSDEYINLVMHNNNTLNTITDDMVVSVRK